MCIRDSKGAPPQFLSTHPSSSTRIQEIQASLPKVTPLYDRAPKPKQRWDAPQRRGALEEGAALAYWGKGSPSLATGRHDHHDH